MGDEKPSRFGCWGSLKVSCETAAASEPRKGPFDDPASRQELEAFDAGRAFDNLDVPRPAMGECVDQLFAAVNSIGKDMPKPGKAIVQALQQRDRSVDILHVGGMNVDSKE